MEDRLVMSRCHEYDGPAFTPEKEYYDKARYRDLATGTKVHRFEAEKYHRKVRAVDRKRERDSFIPEVGNYYKPVNWSSEERVALSKLRDDPGGAGHHNGTNTGLSRIAAMYGDRNFL